ncbi:TolC family outer membrane protein [Aquabacterium sp. UBA2148]|uniref:TolC family outer membrane protein n=1 Tax=Aquabacterium sp. UBA2148 TaxID=1946042 RepID=UPI00257E35B1|nr:TolC family outer membrane protein [Aquabacterium sp. UBA2148]
MSQLAVTPLPQRAPSVRRRRSAVSRAIAVMAAGAFASGMAQADNLLELYEAAKLYDAAYLAARAQAESAYSKADQAKALVRPSLNLQASITRTDFNSSASAQTTVPGAAASYDSNTTNKRAGIQARQTLYNADSFARLDQADQSRLVADADLQVASQDLAVRVTQAYFDVLGAQDVLSTAQANKAALAEQLAAAKRSFEVGNSTITDTREAQARHDLATAQELAAANELRVKRITLDQLVGRANVIPNPLRTPATLDSLAPGEMEEWVNQSQASPNVLKASAGLEAAKLEIKRARAGHLPTLDAVASLQRTDIDSSNQLAKTSGGAGTSAAIGLEMNMSLYAGNSVQNRIAEVLKLQEKAEHDLDNAKRQVTLGTRQAYLGVQSGLAQVKAYEAAESSAKLALEATQLGYRVGVRINKDVLDAQTQLANTQKDLFKSRYDVIVGSVKLRQASGVLTQDDLAELNKLLAN